MKQTKAIGAVFLLCLLLSIHWQAVAQDSFEQKAMIKEHKKNLDKLFTSIEDFTFTSEPGMRRVSVVNITFSKDDIAPQTAELIKTEIENALVKNGFSVLKITEFQMTPYTHVQANDSMMKISHLKPANQLKSNSDSMLAIARKYGIQGYIDCHLSLEEGKGFMLSVQLINSITRELISSAVIMSRPKADNWESSEFVLSSGFGSFNKAEILVRRDTVRVLEPVTTNYFNIGFTWRQPFNAKRTGYFGFNVGGSLVQTQSGASIILNLLTQGGARYYIPFFERKKNTGNYYFEWFQGLGIYNGKGYNLFAEQGLNANITNNMGVNVMFNYLFNNMFINDGDISTGNTTFAVNAYYRF